MRIVSTLTSIRCPESLKHLQSHHGVILIDNTYRNNGFNLPLMITIGWSFLFNLIFVGNQAVRAVEHLDVVPDI